MSICQHIQSKSQIGTFNYVRIAQGLPIDYVSTISVKSKQLKCISTEPKIERWNKYKCDVNMKVAPFLCSIWPLLFSRNKLQTINCARSANINSLPSPSHFDERCFPQVRFLLFWRHL